MATGAVVIAIAFIFLLIAVRDRRRIRRFEAKRAERWRTGDTSIEGLQEDMGILSGKEQP